MSTTTRIAAVLLLLVAAASLSAQVISQRQSVRKRRVAEESPNAAVLARAEAAIQKKDYAAAEPLLKQIVAQEPNHYTAWFDLGFVYNASGRTVDSIAAYRKSVAAKPDLFEPNFYLGLMLARAGDPEAAKFLRAATQLKPASNPQENHAQAWLVLGQVLAKSEPAQALAAFREAARLQPKNPEPHFAAARILEQQNDLAAAEKEFSAAAALDPKSSAALIGLIGIYTKGGRLPQAEDALRRFIGLNPQDEKARAELARVLAAQGKTEEALKELQARLQASPDDLAARRAIAGLYMESKQYAQAVPQYQVLVQKNSNDPELHAALGAALLRAGNFSAAEAELLSAVKLKPDYVEAWGDLALAASDNKNYPLTIQALDARAKYAQEVPFTIFLRATAYDHLRDFKQAAALYHQFLEIANGRFPDQEWQAKHRLIAIEPKKQ